MCARLGNDVVADILQIQIFAPIEKNAKRAVPRMFFRAVKRHLYVADVLGIAPGEASAGKARFESAVPDQRTRRIGRRWILHDRNGLLPGAHVGGWAAPLFHRVGIVDHIPEWDSLLQPV